VTRLCVLGPRACAVQCVGFAVPPGTTANRFSSSLQLPTSGVARIAPEFVNIRHRVVQAGARAEVTIDDMQLLPEEKFNGRPQDMNRFTLATTHATAGSSRLWAASPGAGRTFLHIRRRSRFFFVGRSTRSGQLGSARSKESPGAVRPRRTLASLRRATAGEPRTSQARCAVKEGVRPQR
jgi:hypothetical protein